MQKIKFIFLSLLISALFLSCEVKETVLPSWENKTTVPLISKSFTSLELISESDTSIKTDNLKNYYFFESRIINPVTFDNKIKISDKTNNGSTPLDSLKIGAISTSEIKTSLGKMNPSLGSVNNKTVPVSAFNFNLPAQSFSPLTDFNYAILDQKQFIQIKIVNNLTIPISTLTISIKEANPSKLIVSKTISAAIGAGQTSIQSVDVSGKTLPNDLALEITGSSTGSGAANVKVDTSLGLKFSINSGDLHISEANAKIVATDFSTKDSIAIEQNEVVAKNVIVRSGTMQIDITNGSEITGFVDISSSQVKTSVGGSSFTKSIPIKSKQSSSPILISMDNFVLDFPDKPSVRFDIKVRVSASTGFATVKKTDKISYSTKLLGVKPLKVVGDFKETVDSNKPDTSEISFPKDLDGVDLFFDKGTIDATIFNGLGVPVKVNPVIVLQQKNGALDTIKFKTGVFPVTLPASLTPGVFQKITKSISLSDIPGINEKFNLHPKRVWFFGNATAAPGGYNNGFIFDTSSVRGNVQFTVPLRVKSNSGFKKETTSTFSPESFQSVQSALLNINVTNKVPFRIAFRIAFLDAKNDTVLTFPKKTESSFYRELQQPALNTDGSVSSALTTTLTPFEMNRAELDLLEKSVKVVLKLKVFTSNTSSGNYIQLNSADQLKFVIYSTVGAKIN